MQSIPTFEINNRRYLGSKFKLLSFLSEVIEKYCIDANSFCDLFAGTAVVGNHFNKQFSIITNDILQSNVYAHATFLGEEPYDCDLLKGIIAGYNQLKCDEIAENYYSKNFSNTFLSHDNLKKVGFIRDDIDNKFITHQINLKEKSILITSLLYAVDKIANTVGHYDAYRSNGELDKALVLGMPKIEQSLNKGNVNYNEDAGVLINKISADVIYIDPPYNSRQYCDAYHFLENLAVNEKPDVVGVARKMDRAHLKSQYCTTKALTAFNQLIADIDAKYILFSYNNTGDRANNRSNAKIKDGDIIAALEKKGKVFIEEKDFKAFSTGKSDIQGLTERVFVCIVDNKGELKGD